MAFPWKTMGLLAESTGWLSAASQTPGVTAKALLALDASGLGFTPGGRAE
jgi:hypothetical protein